MKLIEGFVRNPIFSLMLAVGLIMLGLFSRVRIGLDMMPKVDFPVVLITTAYPGASPEEVENSVTEKIEDAVGTISGLKHLTAYSFENLSMVVAEFHLEVDSDEAAQDIRERVSAIVGSLPTDAKLPEILKFDVGAMPVLEMVVKAPGRTASEIQKMAKDIIKPHIESVTGVGRVILSGGRQREFQVLLDAERLEAHNIPFSAVVQALKLANLEMPLGKTEGSRRELAFRSVGKLKSTEDVSYLVVVNSPMGGQIRIRNLGMVVDGVKDVTEEARLNLSPTVMFSVIKQEDANVVKVADGVMDVLKSGLKKVLPPDVELVIARDNSRFIRRMISDMMGNIYIGSLLAIFVILLFLGSYRGTILVSFAIPTSLIATFILMQFAGFTINITTLLGLTVVAGMVVDMSIVTLENIYRHIQGGKSPVTAAIDATSEIWLALTASTFTTLAVFIPIGYMKGIMGRFFHQFGLTVAFAVAVSLLVSISVIPALSSQIYRPGEHIGWVKWFLHGFQRWKGIYEKALGKALSRPYPVLIITFLAFVSIIPGFFLVRKSFVPPVDMAEFQVYVKLPIGSSLSRTLEVIRPLEEALQKIPEVRYVLSRTGSGEEAEGFFGEGQRLGSHESLLTAILTDKEERSRSVWEIMRYVEAKIVPAIRMNAEKVFVYQETRTAGTVHPISIDVRGKNKERLLSLTREILQVVGSAPGIKNPDSTLPEGKPELHFIPDRDLLAKHHLTQATASVSLRGMVFGEVATTLRIRGEDYDLRVRLQEGDRDSPERLKKLHLVNGLGEAIPLESVGRFEFSEGSSSLTRKERFPAYSVFADLDPGTSLGTALSSIKHELNKRGLPPEGFYIDFVGEAELFKEMAENFVFAFILGAILVFIILASQFNSLAQPLIIMLAIPLDVVGAVWALVLTGRDFNVVSSMAILMLSGVVVNQSIIMVTFINQRIQEGMGVKEAIVNACGIRLRPILMTQLTSIAAVFPTALGLGSGGEWRGPMGTAFIGGMLLSTFLTLFVIPVFYLFYFQLNQRMKRRVTG